MGNLCQNHLSYLPRKSLSTSFPHPNSHKAGPPTLSLLMPRCLTPPCPALPTFCSCSKAQLTSSLEIWQMLGLGERFVSLPAGPASLSPPFCLPSLLPIHSQVNRVPSTWSSNSSCFLTPPGSLMGPSHPHPSLNHPSGSCWQQWPAVLSLPLSLNGWACGPRDISYL